jgi:hypothetical protein
MEKKYRINKNGIKEVAVLVSGGFGAGWYTWGMGEKALFDPVIVDFLENNKNNSNELAEYLEKEYPDEYYGGLDGLYVEWVPEGSEFIIDEYDGSEHLSLKTNINWLIA